MEETGQEFGLGEADCAEALAKARQILYEARAKRPRPHLDDKMLTAWNGELVLVLRVFGVVNKKSLPIDCVRLMGWRLALW